MPTWPLVNFSTLSCSFMVNEPGAIDAGVLQALDVLDRALDLVVR